MLLEVGLENSYSYTKGCYLGQEVVERIRSRGHVNRKLCGLVLDGNTPASLGDAIIAAGNEVGKITSSVVSLAFNRPIALGYIHKDFLVARHEAFPPSSRHLYQRRRCRFAVHGTGARLLLNPAFNSVY